MATNERGDLICVQCSKKLTGRQTLYCSEKCRKSYKRNPDGRTRVRTDKPGQTREGARTGGHEPGQSGQIWRDQYHQIKGERDTIKGERDRLLSEVEALRKQTVQLSVERDAALIEKARFEGAYLALSEGRGSVNQIVEPIQENITETQKRESDNNGSLWKRVSQNIKNKIQASSLNP